MPEWAEGIYEEAVQYKKKRYLLYKTYLITNVNTKMYKNDYINMYKSVIIFHVIF